MIGSGSIWEFLWVHVENLLRASEAGLVRVNGNTIDNRVCQFDFLRRWWRIIFSMWQMKVENCNGFDISLFEMEELAHLGMPKGIIMRHHQAHFQYLFASSHYAACNRGKVGRYSRVGAVYDRILD